jgi:hypothetical protein
LPGGTPAFCAGGVYRHARADRPVRGWVDEHLKNNLCKQA